MRHNPAEGLQIAKAWPSEVGIGDAAQTGPGTDLFSGSGASVQQLLQFGRERPGGPERDPVEDLIANAVVDPDPGLARAVLDACRIRIHHLFDKLSSLSNSRTRLLPHQIDATHQVAQALKPRFLLADEVGLGKTVEAGLIIKELSFRRNLKRSLIVAPATLCYQWQREMSSKFNEEYVILTRRNLQEVAASWSSFPRIITSVDFVKTEAVAYEVLRARWDIVVFDEAHRLRRDYSKVTQAYAFADQIAPRAEALLLLSATPFRGKLEELFYLIRLVDPDLLGPHSSFMQEYAREDTTDAALARLRERLSRVLIRRRKVEVGGFTKRFACTIMLELAERERLLYDETTEYVRREYNLAMQEKNRAVGFIMIVFQKLLDSSTNALVMALERRRVTLEQRMFGAAAVAAFDEDDLEFLLEDDVPEDRLSQLDPGQRTLRDTRRELLTLNRLIAIGRGIRSDRKLEKLRESLELLRKQGRTKFVIFTQFRSTQDYLSENLKTFRVIMFHGSLSAEEKEDAIRRFEVEAEILICTEAGGEGRNLQFASVLFNYDLPWSPLKIEQRIGRIHRFGQKDDVKIFNFSTRDTVAERVLQVLEKKIRLFEQSIGPSDALLGAVEDEGDFEASIMNMAMGRKSKAEFEAEVESRIKLAESGYQKLNDLVTPHCIDLNLNDYYAHTRRNREIDNSEIERLTLQYVRSHLTESFQLEAPPGSAKQKAPVGDNAELRPEYVLRLPDGQAREATFRSETALECQAAEYLAVGHELVDRALEHFLHQRERAVFLHVPPSGALASGWLFVFLVRYQNAFNRAELVPVLRPVGAGPCHFPDVSVEDILTRLSGRTPLSGVERAAGLLRRLRLDEGETQSLRGAATDALMAVRLKARDRAEELRRELHPVFKKEEYKLEISYGKKTRLLSEQLDRRRLRYHLQPRVEYRAAVTRTENDLARTRRELEVRLESIRRDSEVECSYEILQAYRVARSVSGG